MAAVDPKVRSRVLRVIFISLLLDLVRATIPPPNSFLPRTRNSELTRRAPLQISFTFILPLFPALLEFYRNNEAPSLVEGGPATLLQRVLAGLNRYKSAFSRPIEARYDIVLLGGAMGSLFSYAHPNNR